MSGWLSAKINALGEKVMDSVLDAVTNNQEVHFRNLQHMQQWSVSRLVNRVVNAKYFYRQANVAPCLAFDEIFPPPPPLSAAAAAAVAAAAAAAERDMQRRPAPGNKLQNTPRATSSSSRGGSSKAPSGCTTEENIVVQGLPSQAGHPHPQQQQRQGSLLLPFIPRDGVGRLFIRVPGACLLLFSAEGVRSSPLLLQREKHQQQLTWMLRALVENQQQQSRTVRLSSSSNNSSDCVNELPFDASFEFPVRDLWTDISLEVICIRPCRQIILKAHREAGAAATPANSSGNTTNAHAPLEDVSGLSAAAAAGRLPPQQQEILLQQLQQHVNSQADDSNFGPIRQQEQQQQQGLSVASTDLAPSDAFPSLDERQLYGRVIIPLSSFLRAVAPVQKQGERQQQRWCWATGSGWVSEGEFWAHLYPDNKKQQERKYLRPVRGFEDYGMKNPVSSLGFLRMQIRFEWLRPPYAASLLSICLPPSSIWVVPSSPEPHYVQTFGIRCRNWSNSEPRWVTKFIKLGYTQKDSTSPCYSSSLLPSSSCNNKGGGGMGFPDEHLLKSQRAIPLPVLQCSTRSLPPPAHFTHPAMAFAGPAVTTSGNVAALDFPTSAIAPAQYADGVASKGKGAQCPAGLRSHAIWQVPQHQHQQMQMAAKDAFCFATAAEQEVTSGVSPGQLERLQRADSFSQEPVIKRPSNQGLWPLLSLGTEDGESGTAPTEAAAGTPSATGTATSCSATGAVGTGEETEKEGASIVHSPFGKIRVSVHSRPIGGEEWPIFADDEAEPLLAQQLHYLVELSTVLQLFFGYTAQFLDKLKYAFNWEDPLLTFGSVVLLLLHGLLFSLLLQLFSFLPFQYWRLLAFCCLLFGATNFTAAAKSVVSFELSKLEARRNERLAAAESPAAAGAAAAGAAAAGAAAAGAACFHSMQKPVGTEAHSDSANTSTGDRSSAGRSAYPQKQGFWLAGILRQRRGSSSSSSNNTEMKTMDQAPAAVPSARTAGGASSASDLGHSSGGNIAGDEVLLLPATGGSGSLGSRLRQLLFRGCMLVLAVFVSAFRVILGLLDTYITGRIICAAESAVVSYFAIIAFWWLHLPEQREMEHRQIAVSQLLPSLSVLIPPEDREVAALRPQQQQHQQHATASTPGSRPQPAEEGMTSCAGVADVKPHGLYPRDVYTFLRRYCRSRWQRENPVTAQLYAAAPYLMPRSRSSSLGLDESPSQQQQTKRETTSFSSLSAELSKAASSSWGFTAGDADLQQAEQQQQQQQAGSNSPRGLGRCGSAGTVEGGTGLEFSQPLDKGLCASASLTHLTAQGEIDRLLCHPEFLAWQRCLFERGQQPASDEMSEEDHQHLQRLSMQQQPQQQDSETAQSGQPKRAQQQQQQQVMPDQQGTQQEAAGPFGGLGFPGLKAFFGHKSKNSDQQACKKSSNEGGNSSSSACVERDMNQLDSGPAQKEGQRRLAVRFCDGSFASVVGTCDGQQQQKQDCSHIEGPQFVCSEEVGGTTRSSSSSNWQAAAATPAPNSGSAGVTRRELKNNATQPEPAQLHSLHGSAHPEELATLPLAQEQVLQHPGDRATAPALPSINSSSGNTAAAFTMSPTATSPGEPMSQSTTTRSSVTQQEHEADPAPSQQQHPDGRENAEATDLWCKGQQHAQMALQHLQSVQQQLIAMEEQQTILARKALQVRSAEATETNQEQQLGETNEQQQSENQVETSPNDELSKAPLQQQQQQQPPWWVPGPWNETVSSPLGPARTSSSPLRQEQPSQQQRPQLQQRYFSSSIPDLSSRSGWLLGSGELQQQQSDPTGITGRSNSLGFLTEKDTFSAAIASIGNFVESLGWNLNSSPTSVPSTVPSSDPAVAASAAGEDVPARPSQDTPASEANPSG